MIDDKEISSMENSKEAVQENVKDFIDVYSIEEAYSSSNATIDETAEIRFRNDLKDLVEKALKSKQIHDCEIDWDLLRFLGIFIGIDDFHSNLFSSWILRTLAEQIVTFFNNISESNYQIFICWLYQEINIVCNNPDVSREQFFEFMNTMFYHALIEISNGKGLLPLSNFIHEHTMIGNVGIKLGKISSITGCHWMSSTSETEEEADYADYAEASRISSDSNFKPHEDSLHAIIEATYQVFGDELNYYLVQSAFESQKEILYYKLPYHCREPRIVKRPMPSEKPSITSNSKLDKTKKKRKSLKKESIEMPQDMLMSIDSASILDKRNLCEPEYIMPLSETLEADNAINYDEESEEIKSDE